MLCTSLANTFPAYAERDALSYLCLAVADISLFDI